MDIERVIAVIVAYTNMTSLELCINALCSQSTPVFQIIVIDNSQSCNVTAMIDRLPRSQQEMIQYHATATNIGSAGGFAKGITLAYKEGAEWIWLHDEDDYPDKDCLEKLLGRKGGMIRTPQIVDPKTGKDLRYFKRVQGPLGYFYSASPYRLCVDVAGTAGLLIHRDVITRIGTYDTDFFIGYEDYDYCLRARRAGLSVTPVNEAVVFHPDHQSTTFSRYPNLDHILAYLPSFWGGIRKGSNRDIYAIRNYIIVSKRYKSRLIVFLEFLTSCCVLPILALFNPRISLHITLKTYLKALCAG